MSILSNVGSALYSIGNFGFKVGLVVLPVGRAVFSSGVVRLGDQTNHTVDPEVKARVAKIAESMEIVSPVSCIASGGMTSPAVALGSNFSWSNRALFVNSSNPLIFNCAHELVHIKKIMH